MTVIIADVLRIVNGALSLVLLVVSMYGLAFALTRDQWWRFASQMGFAVIVAGSHVQSLGRPLAWQHPALLAVLVAATISTVIFVRREQRTDRDRR